MKRSGRSPAENVHREEAPPTLQEEVEENVEIEDDEVVGQEKDAQTVNICIPSLNPVFAQQIMSILKGSVILGSFPQCKWLKLYLTTPLLLMFRWLMDN